MNVVLGLFCVCLPLFLVLLSYQLVVSVSSLSSEQERWMSYFEGGREVEGNYTALELSHMEDVKRVIERVMRVFWGVMGVGLLLAGYLYRRNALGKALWYGGITTIGGVGVIIVWAILSFQSLFTAFHLLLFSQGNWQFGADSLLIQMFPLEFFISMSVKIFGLAMVLAGGVMGVGYWLKKKEKKGRIKKEEYSEGHN